MKTKMYIFFKNIIKVSNSLIIAQNRRFVGPELGPNCLQILLSGDKKLFLTDNKVHCTCNALCVDKGVITPVPTH